MFKNEIALCRVRFRHWVRYDKKRMLVKCGTREAEVIKKLPWLADLIPLGRGLSPNSGDKSAIKVVKLGSSLGSYAPSGNLYFVSVSGEVLSYRKVYDRWRWNDAEVERLSTWKRLFEAVASFGEDSNVGYVVSLKDYEPMYLYMLHMLPKDQKSSATASAQLAGITELLAKRRAELGAQEEAERTEAVQELET